MLAMDLRARRGFWLGGVNRAYKWIWADCQPPRKGCDKPFLDQLLVFQPLTVVYVSCNVHTQARDVGQFLRDSAEKEEEKGGKYWLESLRGFDLFPQVRHLVQPLTLIPTSYLVRIPYSVLLS